MRKTIAILLLVLTLGCAEEKMVRYTIKMKLIDGSWTTRSYMLPEDAYFHVYTHRGSYELRYAKSRIVKSAVIDFKILKKGK